MAIHIPETYLIVGLIFIFRENFKLFKPLGTLFFIVISISFIKGLMKQLIFVRNYAEIKTSKDLPSNDKEKFEKRK